MLFSKVINFVSFIASYAARGVSVVGATALVIMMFMTGVDVTGRYLFNFPVPGSMELQMYLMAVVVGLALAYCALHKGHVRVELVISRLPRRAQLAMNIIASFVFLCLFIVITWRTVHRAQAMIAAQEESIYWGIPVSPFLLTVTVGCAVLCLVLLKDFIEDIHQLYQVVKE